MGTCSPDAPQRSFVVGAIEGSAFFLPAKGDGVIKVVFFLAVCESAIHFPEETRYIFSESCHFMRFYRGFT